MGVGAGLYMYDVVVKKFTFANFSPDEFLSNMPNKENKNRKNRDFSSKIIVASNVRNNYHQSSSLFIWLNGT